MMDNITVKIYKLVDGKDEEIHIYKDDQWYQSI